MAERKSFLLRIDPQLWADLESWAQAELRSVNGQIEYVLRRAVEARRGERVRSDQGDRRDRSDRGEQGDRGELANGRKRTRNPRS